MLFEKTSLVAVFILIGYALVFWDFASTEQVLYQENFESDHNTGSYALTCTDCMLSLDTGSPENMSGGEWN